MNRLSSLLVATGLFFLIRALPTAAQAPTKLWDKTFGGTRGDVLNTVQQTSDGGYLLGGYSNSPLSGDKTQPSRGEFDYWLLKVDASGSTQWDTTLGGSGYDNLTSVQQTSDGGYILGGTSPSPLSGDKTQASQGSWDYWVIKLDASGRKQWDRTFGGSGQDQLSSLRQTTDGGYILGGYSSSPLSGDKTQPSRGNNDYWLVKVDANGTKQWDQTYGGSDLDFLLSVQQTSEGGYLLGGYSSSPLSGEKSQASRGESDYWVVKVDAAGTKQWDRTYGGGDADRLTALQQTSDGGYILGGESSSPLSGDKTQPSRGGSDCWLVKLDASGQKQWDTTLGGSEGENLASVQQTNEGGYLLGGNSFSGRSGEKSQPSQGSADYWVVKLDASGTLQWDTTLGGSKSDDLAAVQQTRDGGYILGGTSTSPLSGDKTQANLGTQNYWLVRLSATPLSSPTAAPSAALTAFPNPTTAAVTLRGPTGTPYQLLNQLGQVVRTGKISAQPLDVRALPAGLYLLRDATSGRATKLVKE